MDNWEDTYRGVVHMGNSACGYEYTVCGLAFDEPISEYGAEMMTKTNKPCTCHDCIAIAKKMFPYFKKELKRVKTS